MDKYPKVLFIFFLSLYFALRALTSVSNVYAQDASVNCSDLATADCFSLINGTFDASKYQGTCSNEIQQAVDDCKQKIQAEQNELAGKLGDKTQVLKQLTSEANSTSAYINSTVKSIVSLQRSISALNSSLDEINSSIDEYNAQIKQVEANIKSNQESLKVALRNIYESDHTSIIETIFNQGTISQVGNIIVQAQDLQEQLLSSLQTLRVLKDKLAKEKEYLQSQQDKKEQAIEIKQAQQSILNQKKAESQDYLTQVLAAKTPVEQEVATLKAQISDLNNAMAAISRFLSLSLGYEVTYKDIFSAVQNAASKTGRRPAFMLAILQAESAINKTLSNKGSREANIQQCVDMCSALPYSTCCPSANSYKTKSPVCSYGGAFGRRAWCTSQQDSLEFICNNFGLDANDANRVRITKDYGMGPAQFQPPTWLAYGAGGNPWRLVDAVTAMAKKLSNRFSSEYSAAVSYNGSSSYGIKVCGNTSCTGGYTGDWQGIIDQCGMDPNCGPLQSRLQSLSGGK